MSTERIWDKSVISERFQELKVFLEEDFGLHLRNFLEENELVSRRKEDDVLMLVFAPPFVESDRIGIERNLGFDLGGEPWKIDHDLEPHDPFVIGQIRAAELGNQRVKYLSLIDLENFFADDHLMDPDRITIQPLPDAKGHGTIPGIQRQVVFGIVDFARFQLIIVSHRCAHNDKYMNKKIKKQVYIALQQGFFIIDK